MSYYQYPLTFRFKLIALAPRIIVTDASGREILYIHQKTFALKEDIRIYRDQSKAEEVFHINAEKILDFNTRYNFYESRSEKHIGSVKARGWRSIWKATYHIEDQADIQTHYIQEDNPWVKVADTLISEIPFVSMVTGYFLHPSYTAYRGTNVEDMSEPEMTLKKEPAFFEGVYTLNLVDEQISSEEEMRLLLSFLLMVQFMRSRG
jgi:hypothetical protein